MPEKIAIETYSIDELIKILQKLKNEFSYTKNQLFLTTDPITIFINTKNKTIQSGASGQFFFNRKEKEVRMKATEFLINKNISDSFN